jgi:16S rRNA (cytidine1402-2'-O)-methyltransferase
VSAPDRGTLLLVATPIGNLGDLSPRAISALADATLVCCEDTRRTRGLLSAAGVPAGDRLLSLHGHNESDRFDRVRSCLASGGTVVVVSDAGTPGISDPGSMLVAAMAAEGETVSTVPGPTSVIGALVVSGLPTDRFCVEGFLPRKGPERRERVAAVMGDARTTVLLEAPGRVAATLGDLAGLDADRAVAVVRELTKVHEEVWRGSAAEGAAHWSAHPPRGEVVIVVGGAPAAAPLSEDEVEAAVRARMAEQTGVGPRQLAEALSLELGIGRRQVYELALRLRSETGAR